MRGEGEVEGDIKGDKSCAIATAIELFRKKETNERDIERGMRIFSIYD